MEETLTISGLKDLRSTTDAPPLPAISARDLYVHGLRPGDRVIDLERDVVWAHEQLVAAGIGADDHVLITTPIERRRRGRR